MNFRICLILFLFTSCIGIWCQETEKKPSQTIYEEFECKISKSVNGKQLLPISVEIKNISDKPVIVLEKNEDRIYKQVTSRISNFGPDIIMHGSLKGAKTSVLAPSESFTIDMDFDLDLEITNMAKKAVTDWKKLGHSGNSVIWEKTVVDRIIFEIKALGYPDCN